MEDKWKVLIFASVILAGSYVYVQSEKLNYQRQKDMDKITYEQEQALKKEDEQRDNKIDRDECIVDAAKNYLSDWDSTCKLRKEKKDCALPLYLSDRLNKSNKEAKEECIKMYPIN